MKGNITIRAKERTHEILKELQDRGAFQNRSEVIRAAITTMYIFHVHHEDIKDAIYKVASEKGIVELLQGNKYVNYEEKIKQHGEAEPDDN
jgi:Arc/MetJ-type ribon-helix-helix transcriptional regulator